MTNIFNGPEKLDLKTRLLQIGVEALEKNGWEVKKTPGYGSSVRKITKGGKSMLVSIRTTQDQWIAFPRTDDGLGWRTLDDMDAVVAVSVDDRENPKYGQVHMIPGDEMRDRFNRAYAARKQAGHSLPVGRGIWVSLYREDVADPPTQVGAGAGVKHPALAKLPLEVAETRVDTRPSSATAASESEDAPLTIAEAKRRLALTLGVDPASIKISVEA